MGNKSKPSKRIMVREKRKRKTNAPICADCLELVNKGLLKKGRVGRILHKGRELCEEHFQERIGRTKPRNRALGTSSRRTQTRESSGVQSNGKLMRFLV